MQNLVKEWTKERRENAWKVLCEFVASTEMPYSTESLLYLASVNIDAFNLLYRTKAFDLCSARMLGSDRK